MAGMHVAAGALTGFVVGLTGVGGGALMTPLLLLFFGVAPLTAVGTDLWFAAITKLVITRVHHNNGLIDWQVAKRLSLGSLSASGATLAWMRVLPPVNERSVALLNAAIAAAVCLTAIGLLFQKSLHPLGQRLGISSAERFGQVQVPLTVAAGAILGGLVTLTSVGAGALGAIFLVHLYPRRLTPPRLIATDVAHAIPLAVFAGLGHLLISDVDLALLAGLLVGSIPAALVGARLSSRLPHRLLRITLAVVLLIVGSRLAAVILR